MPVVQAWKESLFSLAESVSVPSEVSPNFFPRVVEAVEARYPGVRHAIIVPYQYTIRESRISLMLTLLLHTHMFREVSRARMIRVLTLFSFFRAFGQVRSFRLPITDRMHNFLSCPRLPPWASKVSK
jgi:hypothetical protein